MNKHLKIGLAVLITVILALALSSLALAGTKDTFTLNYYLDNSGWDIYLLDGTFSSTGSIEDEGTATMAFSWRTARPFTFVFAGENGSIMAQMTLSDRLNEDGCWIGTISIFGPYGTGEYYMLMGNGKSTLCWDADQNIWGTIEGITYVNNFGPPE